MAAKQFELFRVKARWTKPNFGTPERLEPNSRQVLVVRSNVGCQHRKHPDYICAACVTTACVACHSVLPGKGRNVRTSVIGR